MGTKSKVWLTFSYLLLPFFLSVVLVGLYEEPERPSNAVDYIKRYMGAPAGVDVEALRVEAEQLRADKAALEETIKQLNAKVSLFKISYNIWGKYMINYTCILCNL